MGKPALEIITSIAKSIDRQIPILAFLGFGAWVGWNLLAFSGNAWLESSDEGWQVSHLLVIHLCTCVVTLAGMVALAKRANGIVARWSFPFLGGSVATVGSVLIVLARPGILLSPAVFVVGCICTGIGTTFLFARCAALYGALLPRTAFIYYCISLLCGCAIYSVARIAPDFISAGVFILLPLFSAFLMAIRPYDKAEHSVLESGPRFTKQFASFLAAIVIFATAAQALNNAAYSLAPHDALVCYDYMVVLLMAICFVLMLGSAASSRAFGFGRIYRPASVAIIALLLIVPFVDIAVTAQVALSTAANYVFNIIVWGMLAYIVFQAQGNALRVFCAGNAALAAGTVLGNLLASTLMNIGVEDQNYMLVCLVLSLCAIIAALFIFPESKMSELLLPIDESRFASGEKASDPFAPWKDACREIAQEGNLTEREEEIFALLARGKTAQQVADSLVISLYTVRAHTRNIYAKLDVHSRNELSALVEKRIGNS